MEDADLLGPLDRRLGRWLLDRLVATAVRHGHPFSIALVRADEAGEIAARLGGLVRGADVVVDWAPGELLLLLPDTDADGAALAAARLQRAVPGIELRAVTWSGDVTEDLLRRAATGLGAVTPR